MFARGLKIVLGAGLVSCMVAMFSAETAQAQYVYAGAGYTPVYYGGCYGTTYVVRTVRYVPAPCYVPAPPCPPPPVVYYRSYPDRVYGFGINVNVRHNDRDDHRRDDGRRDGRDRPRFTRDNRGWRR